MTGYLACVLANRIAAFAPVEAVFFQIPGRCHPAHPAAILDVHVRTDPVAHYAGVPSRGSPDYFALSIPMWLHGWAGRDGCNSGSARLISFHGMTQEAWPRCPGHDAIVGFGNSGEVRSDGRLSLFDIGPPLGGLSDIAQGANGSMWFSEQDGVIGRVAGNGDVTELALPSPESNPDGIAAGRGNTVWVTATGIDAVIEITLR